MLLGTPGSKPLDLDLSEEVASREGVSPLDLSPLYDVIDPDTFASQGAESGSPLFTYVGYDISVDREGCLTVGKGD